MKQIKDMTDNEILGELGTVVAGITMDDIKEAAVKAGSPTALTDKWIKKYKVRGPMQDFLYEAALELWSRHLGHVKCAEVIRRFINSAISDFHKNRKAVNKEFLSGIYEKVHEFYRQLLKGDGMPDTELYNEVDEDGFYEIVEFLLELPFTLSAHGLVDEALNISEWFADISGQPENFLRDRGCILVEAGRKEEAIKQIEENLERFPDDVWVIINAGDAMRALEDLKAAEEFFLKADKMALSKYEKLGAIERLIDLYRKMGREEKAEYYINKNKEIEEHLSREESEEGFPDDNSSLYIPPTKPVVREKKIGRNEPCPCGSRKKYKKCCLVSPEKEENNEKTESPDKGFRTTD